MKYLKQILGILLIGAVLLFINIKKVDATLQANRNTQNIKTDIPLNWMTNFRKMETSGEAMGLNETLNTDLTASSESNNIDVHMMRATEYGAIAILSTSGYGNQKNENAITATTGNNTGMILNIAYWEYTAGTYQNLEFGEEISQRYYDFYTEEQIREKRGKIGDALENEGWHANRNSLWDWVYGASAPCFMRGQNGIFAFTAGSGWSGGARNQYARGVVVCGVGL